MSDKGEVLARFVKRSCVWLKVNHNNVIKFLLSKEDEQDIVSGELTEDVLRAFVKAWMNLGMANYSDKQ